MYNKINLKNIDKIQKIWHYVFLIHSLDDFFLMEQIIGEFWQLIMGFGLSIVEAESALRNHPNLCSQLSYLSRTFGD